MSFTCLVLSVSEVLGAQLREDAGVAGARERNCCVRRSALDIPLPVASNLAFGRERDRLPGQVAMLRDILHNHGVTVEDLLFSRSIDSLRVE